MRIGVLPRSNGQRSLMFLFVSNFTLHYLRGARLKSGRRINGGLIIIRSDLVIIRGGCYNSWWLLTAPASLGL